MKLSAFLKLAKLFGPLIIRTVNPKLGPVADEIVDAINEAEQIPGAKGKDKLKHVQEIIKDSVEISNATGKTDIDVEGLDTAVDGAVSKVIEVIKVVKPDVP
jgi:curved DNA-binding protein CbpA